MDSERLRRLRDLGDDGAAVALDRATMRAALGKHARCPGWEQVPCREGLVIKLHVANQQGKCATTDRLCPGFVRRFRYHINWLPGFQHCELLGQLKRHLVDGVKDGTVMEKARLAITSGAVRCETLLGGEEDAA